MVVKSITIGDVFLSVNGDRWTITDITCGLDEDEDRWETSITYELFTASIGITSYQITQKARVAVQILSTDAFYSQVHASGGVTKSNTVKPAGNSQIQNDFIENAAKYGLSPSDLGRTALLGGSKKSKYQIVGAKPKSRTMKIVVEGPSGGLRRFTPDEVREGLELYRTRKVRVK